MAVTDGVTVGHPCCAVHDCKVPLARQYHRYCPEHEAMDSVCAIRDCPNAVRPGHATCAILAHSKYEEEKRASNRASYRLKQSLQRSLDPKGEDNEDSSQPTRLSGSLTRRWTHNEQLVVRPCQVIIARGTFFGSEAISAVKVSR